MALNLVLFSFLVYGVSSVWVIVVVGRCARSGRDAVLRCLSRGALPYDTSISQIKGVFRDSEVVGLGMGVVSQGTFLLVSRIARGSDVNFDPKRYVLPRKDQNPHVLST